MRKYRYGGVVGVLAKETMINNDSITFNTHLKFNPITINHFMTRINIKALSVNACWRGRRFKTPEYTIYEKELSYELPELVIPEGKLSVKLEIGYSSIASDIDNFIKPFLDILQKKYLFNDKMIYKLEVSKVIVPKGQEFIEFAINPLNL